MVLWTARSNHAYLFCCFCNLLSMQVNNPFSIQILGNDLMKAGKFTEGIESYTRAIDLDGNNAVFFSNRLDYIWQKFYKAAFSLKNLIFSAFTAVLCEILKLTLSRLSHSSMLSFFPGQQHTQNLVQTKKQLQIVNKLSKLIQTSAKLMDDWGGFCCIFCNKSKILMKYHSCMLLT